MIEESETLELKTSFGEWKEIIISLVAFANAKGGKVLVGINDKGGTTHLEIGKSKLEDFVNKICQNTDPVLYPSINKKTFGPTEIVEIEVKESDSKPVFAFGRAYLRMSKVNQKLSVSEIKRLIYSYKTSEFESDFLNIPFDEISWDLKRLQKFGRDLPEGKRTSENILKKNGFLLQGKITKGGYLCFVEKNTALPVAIVKAARFKGNTTEVFVDMKEFDSNILVAADEILEFIRRHTSLKVTLTGSPRRQEQWEYPMVAVREAVINALVHRDYTDPGHIQIRIFDNRLEIVSPGLLPREISPETLESEMRSIPRNPKLAYIFHREKLIEAWGTGFHRMRVSCKQMNFPDPEFFYIKGAFSVRFNKRNHSLKQISKTTTVSQKSGLVPDQENIERDSKQLLQLIQTQPGLRLSQISTKMQVSQKTLERWIKALKGQNLVVYRGSKKSGGYEAI